MSAAPRDDWKKAVLWAAPIVLIVAAGMLYYQWGNGKKALDHADLLEPDTAVRVVIAPPRIQSYLSSLAPAATRYVQGLPKLSSMQSSAIHFDWIHKLPLEMAFLFDQRDTTSLRVKLFFREHPEGEPLNRTLSDGSFLEDLYPLLWEDNGLRSLAGGRYAVQGRLEIPPAYQEAMARYWPNYQPLTTPEISGNHFIEAGINNRDGALAALFGAFLGHITPWAEESLQERLFDACTTISDLALTVDLEGDDLLGFYLTLRMIDEGNAEKGAALLTTAGEALTGWLNTAHHLSFVTTVAQTGDNVTLTGRLSGFEVPLRRRLGG